MNTTSEESLTSERSTQQLLIAAASLPQSSSSSPPPLGRVTPLITPPFQPSESPHCIPGARRQLPRRQAHGLAKTPRGPRSPLRPSVGPSCVSMATFKPLADSKERTIKIGIEVEFELAARYQCGEEPTLTCFVMALANMHNEVVPKRHPRMQDYIRAYNYEGDYDKWNLVEETTIMFPGRPCPPCKPLPLPPMLKLTSGHDL